MEGYLWVVETAAREAMLFAAIGLLIGGVDDLLVDLLYAGWRAGRGRHRRLTACALPPPATAGRIAVLVPAWDEGEVIGAMLSQALARYDHPDYRLYVGVYPNDRATIDAVATVALRDPRVHLVIGEHDGPTTKADNLNAVWRAVQQADADERQYTKAFVLHDAEDLVHPAELRVFDALIGRYDTVQLPVLPLVKRGSAMVSGHYADEFAESHGRTLMVRGLLGAGMPLAGVGCAISAPMLARIAAARGGEPFDAASLVEDYELGLRVADLGGRATFARVYEDDGRTLVAVRAYFPADVSASVIQKARWMTGIALAGWDRIGWAARPLALGDHWMRMRDRRATIAVIVLAVAYACLLLWPLLELVHWARGAWPAAAMTPPAWLVAANSVLLVWRLLVRAVWTTRIYGWREGLLSVPRFAVGIAITLLAAPRALRRYVPLLRGEPPVWDKTRHEFPAVDLAK